MIRKIKKEVTRVKITEFDNPKLTEVIFENPDNWYIVYSLVQLDYQIEYSQSSGHGEICGTYIDTVGSGEEPLFFTDDGRENLKLIRRFKSKTPDFHITSRYYEEIVRKE